MSNLRTAIIATIAAVLAGNVAFAGSPTAEAAHKTVRAEWKKSRAAGGYGFPLVAIPKAIAATMTGKAKGAAGSGREPRTGTTSGN